MSRRDPQSPDPWSMLEERQNESPFDDYNSADFYGSASPNRSAQGEEDDFVFSRSNFVSFGEKDPMRQSDPFTLHARSLHSKQAEIQERNNRVKVFKSGNLTYSHRSLRVEVESEKIEEARQTLTEELHDIMSKHGKFLVCHVYGDREIRCYMVIDREISNNKLLDFVKKALERYSISEPVVTELRSKIF